MMFMWECLCLVKPCSNIVIEKHSQQELQGVCGLVQFKVA